MQMRHLVVDGYALVTIAKLSDYGFHLIRKGVSLHLKDELHEVFDHRNFMQL